MAPAAALAPFQTALGLTVAAVAVVDDRGRVAGWTPGAQRLLGYPADEVVGRCGEELLASRTPAPPGRPEDDVPDTKIEPGRRQERTQAVSGARHWSGVKDLRHRDGRVVRANVEAVPLRRADGSTHWFLWASEFADAGDVPPVRAAVMRTLLDHAPVALALWDTDLNCIWLNTTAEHEAGAFRNRDIGRPVHEALRGFDTITAESVMRRVLRSGEPVIDHEFRWTSEDGGQERVFSSSFFRLDTAAGLPIGVCTIAVDITNSWARARLSVLSRAGRQVGTTLDVVTTARELADVTVPLLADFVAVDLTETVPFDGGPLERIEPTDDRVPLYRRAAAASVHEGVPESAFEDGQVVFVRPGSPYLAAAQGGTSIFEPEIRAQWDTWRPTEPERVAAMERTGIHSLMVVPLKARGAILGVAIFGRSRNVAPFSRDDLLLAEELGLQAGLSVDNARRYTRERTAALALQRNLMPRSLSGGTTVDVASRYLPTDVHEGVGGDWFDVIPLAGARYALVVGDVVGHGINAAAAMGRFRTAVHTLADLDLPPDELLAHLDDLAVHLSASEVSPGAGTATGVQPEAAEAFSPPTMAATCVYAVYDPVTRICTLARAGHPPPAIIDPDGSVSFPDLPPGAPVGMGVGSYESVELELAEGSMIALFTDGLVERRTSDLDTGLDRLAAAVSAAAPGDPLDPLCRSVVDSMTAGLNVEDDIALLLARTRVLAPEQVATWELPLHPSAVADARAAASRQLDAWGLDAAGPTTELIVSELVTNAVRYGLSPVRLRLIRTSALVIEVSDADSSSPRLRHARVTEETGRGLFLVSKTADRWGSRFTPEGKTTWAELDLEARR
ncbi:SpoIIE family protein phosphatase [Streptomyces fuscigenes]|uniref:SpoIIE family protein phosphatase n=1 Tax=Streptomyces fuscigenes TaxID=1528880 RepID=UPI001F390767|nr:SpoIIE family protein phosphatase [Streptomyces fuscigenes]MCF3964593.1 SpoIIE family protein phosphatase [Streptomyces fuscigenes]